MPSNDLRRMLPKFAVNLDRIFDGYEQVYILGDLHDNESALKTFILENNIGFIIQRDDETDITDISNYYMKPQVLLVFLGDVLYKTDGCFKSVMRFILNNKSNCLLLLGNNEVKFVYEHIHLFLEVAENIIPKRRFYSMLSAKQTNQHFKIVSMIYSLIEWYRFGCNDKLREDWIWFYECILREYQSDKNNCENLMFLMYILTESIIVGYSNKLKLVLVHAGFNPQRKLNTQRTSDMCNIRNVKKTSTPWFWYYMNFNFTVLFGHWSALTTRERKIKPFMFQNAICLDTGCCYTNVLSYVSFYPPTLSVNACFQNVRTTKSSNGYSFCEIAIK
jgi:hypothetical protein